MQIDWIGAIYFCSDCFGVAARSLGWVPVAEFNELLIELKNTTAEKDSAVKSNQRIKDGLSLILPELGREPESVDAYIDGLMATIQESPGSEGTDEMHATGESETNESDNVEGPDDLFDASDFDE
ncbi:hypothetical protein [Streptomyces anandii]|uniref:hypothetical protein n=1 Tax=Streptomyces anandii TaxID=285454 RepID=UPI00369346A3